MTKEKKRVVPDCIEWKADGTCAKFKFTEDEGLVLNLKECKEKAEKEKMLKEIKRGFKVEA